MDQKTKTINVFEDRPFCLCCSSWDIKQKRILGLLAVVDRDWSLDGIGYWLSGNL